MYSCLFHVSLVQTNKMSAQHNFTDHNERPQLFSSPMFYHLFMILAHFLVPVPTQHHCFRHQRKKGDLDTEQPYEKQRSSQLDTSTDICMLEGLKKAQQHWCAISKHDCREMSDLFPNVRNYLQEMTTCIHPRHLHRKQVTAPDTERLNTGTSDIFLSLI